jgi:hypothetical protein
MGKVSSGVVFAMQLLVFHCGNANGRDTRGHCDESPRMSVDVRVFSTEKANVRAYKRRSIAI